MKTFPRSLLLIALACLPLGACVVAAGAGVGYLVSREVLDDETNTAQVQDEVGAVFEIARETLGILIEPATEVRTTSAPRTAHGKVDGSDVTVTVEAYDIDRTTIRVQAKGTLGNDGETAERVLNEILRRLNAERAGKP